MPATAHHLTHCNLLLEALWPAEQSLLAPHLEPITLQRGEVLFEPGQPVTHVTFPCGPTIATLLITMQDGRTNETATIGHEGALGGVVSQGLLPAFGRAVVQVPGTALRIEAAQLQVVKQTNPALRNLFTRYADCLLAQVLQSVACNALHPIDQRCAKWLLTLHDRMSDDALPITQDILADMLGVRRTYLSGILRALHDRGLVSVARARLTVLNRPALEAAACECHLRVRGHFAEVLGATYHQDATLVAFDPARKSRRAAIQVA